MVGLALTFLRISLSTNRDGNLWDAIVDLKKMHGTVEIMASAHSIVSNLCKVHVASHEDVSSLPLRRSCS